MNLELLPPMLALMCLTFLVWCHMYALRLSYLFRQGIDPQRLNTPAARDAALPDWVNNPSNNFKNLFEMPVLFYLLCAAATWSGQVDRGWLWMAWGFVALRAVHSAIHCTVNRVTIRFAAYFLSSLLVWAMLARLLLTL